MSMLNWQGWALTNFQGWGSVGTATPVVVATPAVGHGKPRRKRHYVEIDGQYFEVRDEKQAVQILTKLHEAAQETARAAAAEVVAKSAKSKAAAKPVLEAPKVAVVKPDYRQEFTQQLQAKVDAANARLADTYRLALATAIREADDRRALLAADEAEIEDLILMGFI